MHFLFTIAIIIIGLALLPAALAVLPMLFFGGLIIAGVIGVVLLFVYLPGAALAIVIIGGIGALGYQIVQGIKARKSQQTQTPSEVREAVRVDLDELRHAV